MSNVAAPRFTVLQRRDMEGMIPVATEEMEQSFVVDCPALHIVQASNLDGIPLGTPADLLYLGASRYCPLCRGQEVFTKARRVPLSQPSEQHEKPDQPVGSYFNAAAVGASLNGRASGPINALSSISPGYTSSNADSEEMPELARVSSSRSNASSLPSSPTRSLQRLHSISEHSDPGFRSSTQFSVRSSSLSARSLRAPPSYPPPSPSFTSSFAPSVRTVSTEVGSLVNENSTNSASSASTTSSHTETPLLGGLFTRRKKKETSKELTQDPLPDALSFIFSGTGNNLTLWRKNGHTMIQIRIASWEAKRIDLRHTLPAQEANRELNIKLLAEGDGWIAAVIYRKRQFLLVMINQAATQYSLWKLDAHMRPMTLAIARDNSLVAVGYGPSVYLYRFEGSIQSWNTEVAMEGFKKQDDVKHQVISFSNNCRYMTVATQRFDRARGKDDDGMHAHVWKCEQKIGAGFKLDHCRLPSVSLDHIGITSAFFNPELSLATITAFIDAPYPLFLGPQPTKDAPPISAPPSKKFHSHFKARCAAQSTNAAFTSFLTDTNKLHLVDLKTKSVEEWADLTQFRRRELDPKEEVAIMSMPGEKTCQVVWRDGPKLMLCTVMARNRAECKDLRWLIDDAGWGD